MKVFKFEVISGFYADWFRMVRNLPAIWLWICNSQQIWDSVNVIDLASIPPSLTILFKFCTQNNITMLGGSLLDQGYIGPSNLLLELPGAKKGYKFTPQFLLKEGFPSVNQKIVWFPFVMFQPQTVLSKHHGYEATTLLESVQLSLT